MKYEIKTPLKDFDFINLLDNNKGTRPKRLVIDKFNNKAYFKYEHPEYNCSEACSEKLSYEIAKILGFECAVIELAKDEYGKLGVLNYIFTNDKKIEHNDAVSYLKKSGEDRKDFYTLENIKKGLDKLDSNLFFELFKILVFDALIGEQDRHEENWGIIKINKEYHISPLYDNGCSLLNKFKDELYANKYYNGLNDFDSFINRSRSLIYDKNGKKYKHFDLIKELYNKYPDKIKIELKKLERLDDKKIEKIVNYIPDELLTNMHKKYIIKYLKKRRDILLEIGKE